MHHVNDFYRVEQLHLLKLKAFLNFESSTGGWGRPETDSGKVSAVTSAISTYSRSRILFVTFFASEAAGLKGPGFNRDPLPSLLSGARAADASRSRPGDPTPMVGAKVERSANAPCASGRMEPVIKPHPRKRNSIDAHIGRGQVTRAYSRASVPA